MEPILNVKCMNIYEKALKSPVGTGIIEFYSKLKQEETFYEKIKKNLELNIYSCPNDWLNDIRDVYMSEARDVGYGSEISLFILTLLQIIEEKSKYLINDKPNLDYESLINELKDFTKTLPNNEEEFQKILNEEVPNIEVQHYKDKSEKQNNEFLISPTDVYSEVMTLKTDEDMHNVISILSKYEINYTNLNKVFEIDLKNCSQSTLKMIHNYIIKRNKKM